MSNNLKLELRKSTIAEFKTVDETTGKIIITSEDGTAEEIYFTKNSDIERFLIAAYGENIINQEFYQIYDDRNLLGYGSSTEKVLLLKNVENYDSKNGIKYLQVRYKMPEYAFILLAQQEIKSIKSSNRTLRRTNKSNNCPHTL